LCSDKPNIALSGGFLKKYFANFWLRLSCPGAGKTPVKLPTRLKPAD
jgi:hypothetical protein